ncbi:MAG: metal-sulfur cluster assembly factor [Acidilobaceae archaeon]|nr:metal-sulfur cluster assembly factor [Acidilobaceae archaeon]MCX8165717.1 metal-sulfur cluster assembly factor [Acidilobaceae archaeon]MDW7974142.1 metal-sulfur cluster assembly factor [Sulfolobales archaeon]
MMETVNQDNVKIVGDLQLAEKVIAALREVYDPEIPVNVYDLGLVYEIHAHYQEGKPHIKVIMTLTAIGCPVMGQITLFVDEAVRDAIPDAEVDVEITFDPPWTPRRITKEGREQFMAMYGYDVVESWAANY